MKIRRTIIKFLLKEEMQELKDIRNEIDILENFLLHTPSLLNGFAVLKGYLQPPGSKAKYKYLGKKINND